MYVDSWLDRGASSRQVKADEHQLECLVSNYIGQMPFLWLPIDDPSNADSHRAYIERNAIALLSSYSGSDKIDAPSVHWLGLQSSSEKVRKSGLWNSAHVEEVYESEFLDELEGYVMATTVPAKTYSYDVKTGKRRFKD